MGSSKLVPFLVSSIWSLKHTFLPLLLVEVQPAEDSPMSLALPCSHALSPLGVCHTPLYYIPQTPRATDHFLISSLLEPFSFGWSWGESSLFSSPIGNTAAIRKFSAREFCFHCSTSTLKYLSLHLPPLSKSNSGHPAPQVRILAPFGKKWMAPALDVLQLMLWLKSRHFTSPALPLSFSGKWELEESTIPKS